MPDHEEMANKIYTLKTKHRISQSIATWINLLPILQNMESTVTIQFRKMSSWLCTVPLNMSFNFSEPKSITVNQVFSTEEINGFLVGWGGGVSEKNWLLRNRIPLKYQDRSQYYNVLGPRNWKCSLRGMIMSKKVKKHQFKWTIRFTYSSYSSLILSS